MNKLKRLSKLFMALKTRERVLAIVAVLGLVYFAFDLALIRPQQMEARALREKIAQQEAELSGFTKALQSSVAMKRDDPLAAKRAELQALRKTFAEAEVVMGRVSADVRMGDVIRSLVGATPGLTLVSLKTLPVQPMFVGQLAATTQQVVLASAAKAPVVPNLPTLYKHGVEVTVKGGYPSLHSYLQSLERNGSGLFWGDVKLDVTAYPDASLKITLYTLSAKSELPLG